MSVSIRPVCAEDNADWRRLWTGYLEFYETSVTEEVYAETFRRLLDDDPHEFHGLVAVREGRLIGLTHYLFHRHCWNASESILQCAAVHRISAASSETKV